MTFLVQDIYPPAFWTRTFRPLIFWTLTFYLLRFGTITFRPRTFWTWTFRTQDVTPGGFLDLDVSLPDVLDQEVSPPNILDQDDSPPDYCFIIQNICWLCWGLTSQSTIFQSCRDGAIASWVINQYFRGVKCLAQGHNTATVGLEPRTSRSGVRHSTTEPPRSPSKYMFQLKVLSLWEFTLNFRWRCFTIHVALWRYVRDYATLLEVTLTSMQH